MVSTVLSSMPTHYMSVLKLHEAVYKQIDKYRKHFLWRGSDPNNKKPPMAAWHMVTRPKKEGGMGVKNLSAQNDALLMKNLHKIFNHVDTPCLQIVWTNYYNGRYLPGQGKKGSF